MWSKVPVKCIHLLAMLKQSSEWSNIISTCKFDFLLKFKCILKKKSSFCRLSKYVSIDFILRPLQIRAYLSDIFILSRHRRTRSLDCRFCKASSTNGIKFNQTGPEGNERLL